MAAVKVTAYIALGANLQDREAMIRTAVTRMNDQPGLRVEQVSTLHETVAVGGPADSPAFLNAAAKIATTLTPHQLLAALMSIETSLGRVRVTKWEPRVIDLDILLYGETIVSTDDLVIPHPLMHERLFVLKPLAEIAGDVEHPTLHMSISELLERLIAAE